MTTIKDFIPSKEELIGIAIIGLAALSGYIVAVVWNINFLGS